ncbi:MAG: tRNA uridine-5-carboxymethylaminomethyl(34) synthesis GTPase MnmE [Gammaproteobacteria bacterium]
MSGVEEVLLSATETIVACATPPGNGGVGIVRLSGPLVPQLLVPLCGKTIKPRSAEYCIFRCPLSGEAIDEGIALYFPAPHSFTGESVLELQGHGGMVVMDRLVQGVLTQDVRLARPGEFSERAFLNGKMDLTQAEAIADLIHSTSEQGARCALRTLQGAFSEAIASVVSLLISLRTYVEAALDFPDEEIDFIQQGDVNARLVAILQATEDVFKQAQQGCLLQEGITAVIVGPPNAGKSSLLNALSGESLAIVTDIPGTTRDILRHHVHIDGLPIHLLDTAGLRHSVDAVEQEGIRRAQQQIDKADVLILVVDSTEVPWGEELKALAQFVDENLKLPPVIIVRNKADLSMESIGCHDDDNSIRLVLSLKSRLGLEDFRHQLKKWVGFESMTEGMFTAKRRHMDALNQAKEHIKGALQQIGASDLLAEELRLAQQDLGKITGEFTSDDLLGEIFSTFCLGK